VRVQELDVGELRCGPQAHLHEVEELLVEHRGFLGLPTLWTVDGTCATAEGILCATWQLQRAPVRWRVTVEQVKRP
jgi:hypothetical protein